MTHQSTVSVEVPSATTAGVVYLVTRRDVHLTCTCPGFTYRGRCKHLVFAPTLIEVREPRGFDCGICGIWHACHCDRLMAYCDGCTGARS